MKISVWLSSSWIRDIQKEDGSYRFFSRTSIDEGYTYGAGRLKVHILRGVPWKFNWQGNDNRWSKES